MRGFAIILLILLSHTITAQNNWVSNLNDSIPVSRLSIPGAHDAATGNGMASLLQIGITQSKSIEEQWKAGVRVFDLRPAVVNDSIYIYHGPIKTRITFIEAITYIASQLKPDGESAGEFAIILMRNEKDGDGKEQEQWAHKIGNVIESLNNMAAEFHPNITVGELRGKILFLSRNHYSGSDKGAYIEGWNHSKQGTAYGRIIPYNGGRSAKLVLQDFYEATGEEGQTSKLNTIIAHIDSAATAAEGVWCINHASAFASTYFGISGLASNNGYIKNAVRMHKPVINYIKGNTVNGKKKPQGTTGIIMMDYAGEEQNGKHHIMGCSLIKAIINNNK